MQFSSKEDIEAPIQEVFAFLSDLESFERSAIRRGVDVQRLDDLQHTAVGMTWQANFSMRGKKRSVKLWLETFDPPLAMTFPYESNGVNGYLGVELIALSRRRTRMSVVLNLKPKTLSARLLVQSLRLAKANLTKRFKLRVAEFAKRVEENRRHLA